MTMNDSLSKRVVDVLARKDKVGMHAVGRALVHLFNRQTSDEQAVEDTRYDNGIGFTSADARMGTSMAKFYMKNGFLTPKQVAYWQATKKRDGTSLKRARITKYWRQLCEEAQKKMEKR